MTPGTEKTSLVGSAGRRKIDTQAADGLRALATIYIATFHLFCNEFIARGLPGWLPPTSALVCFYVLSGFVLHLGYGGDAFDLPCCTPSSSK